VETKYVNAKGQAELTAGWKPTSTTEVTPMSASGCDNQTVCIDVYGTGTYIDQWNTQAFGNKGCIVAYWQRHWATVNESAYICPNSSGDGVYYANWDANVRYNDGDQVCNQWTMFYGRPCVWIER